MITATAGRNATAPLAKLETLAKKMAPLV